MTRCVALIPARYGSTRLPAKALLDKTGKPLIRHVFERVSLARLVDGVIVATDDERILRAVEGFGGRAVMTSREHRSGSDRIAEAASALDADLILNVQGDEPEIDPELLDRLVEHLDENPSLPLCTAAVPIEDRNVFNDPDTVKVVIDGKRPVGRALYFSRSPVPHGAAPGKPNGPLKHIGVYAFRREALIRFASLPQAPIEKAERLEQLRALCHKMEINVIVTDKDSHGIDTPEDYEAFVKREALARKRAGDSS